MGRRFATGETALRSIQGLGVSEVGLDSPLGNPSPPNPCGYDRFPSEGLLRKASYPMGGGSVVGLMVKSPDWRIIADGFAPLGPSYEVDQDRMGKGGAVPINHHRRMNSPPPHIWPTSINRQSTTQNLRPMNDPIVLIPGHDYRTSATESLQEDIIRYYDECYWDYRTSWLSGTNLAIHYGYWDTETRNHGQALLNMNRLLAETAGIRPGMRVLDAGCGIGGSAIWLAENRGVRVTGITLSELQVSQARRNAESRCDGNRRVQSRGFLRHAVCG